MKCLQDVGDLALHNSLSRNSFLWYLSVDRRAFDGSEKLLLWLDVVRPSPFADAQSRVLFSAGLWFRSFPHLG